MDLHIIAFIIFSFKRIQTNSKVALFLDKSSKTNAFIFGLWFMATVPKYWIESHFKIDNLNWTQIIGSCPEILGLMLE